MIALVLGGADTLPDDLDRLGGWAWWDTVVAVNRAGIYCADAEHWASLHPECFHRDRGKAGWLESRAFMGGDALTGPPTLWGPSSKPTDSVRPLDCTEKGSSGFFGVEVAQHLGADRIILCGIPMTETPHFDSDEPWEMAHAHFKHWTRAHKAGRLDNVRSMSGRTRDLLGAPTREWLAGESPADSTEPEVAGAPHP